MILQNFCFARACPGPRPILPMGGRIVDVTHRTHVLQEGIASRHMKGAHALPGSGAALLNQGMHP